MTRSNVSTGNAGEHLVMAELLARGHHASMADRGNPAFDLLTLHDGLFSGIRVKTTTGTGFQWGAKKDGTIFLDFNPKKNPRDFVVFVQMKGTPRDANIWVVPTKVVDKTVRDCHSHWMKFPCRDGKPKSESLHRGIGLTGRDTESNIAHGFAEKWKRYSEAWHLLEAL